MEPCVGGSQRDTRGIGRPNSPTQAHELCPEAPLCLSRASNERPLVLITLRAHTGDMTDSIVWCIECRNCGGQGFRRHKRQVTTTAFLPHGWTSVFTSVPGTVTHSQGDKYKLTAFARAALVLVMIILVTPIWITSVRTLAHSYRRQ